MITRTQTRATAASTRQIPAYTANGLRLRNYSLVAIERCLAMLPPCVVVKRNKRTGNITSAQFLALSQTSSAVDGKSAPRKTAHLGQRYSYAQRVSDDGHSVWSFVKFLTPATMWLDPDVTADEIEAWLRLVFRAVPLSCIAR